MFMTGFAIFAGVGLLLIKLKRKWMLRVLNHDLALDIAVSVITLLVHWGTFSGVMAATIAGLLTSIATSTAKKLVGYIKNNTYYPGIFNLKTSD